MSSVCQNVRKTTGSDRVKATRGNPAITEAGWASGGAVRTESVAVSLAVELGGPGRGWTATAGGAQAASVHK